MISSGNSPNVKMLTHKKGTGGDSVFDAQLKTALSNSLASMFHTQNNIMERGLSPYPYQLNTC